MNKTININLAGLFFHIDEDAYNKLQRYLNAVKRSFANTPGSEEIMSDIEARIAELFLEKRANELQVISIQHVDEVINIMGQPEDYEVDEDMFEDKKNSTTYKKSKSLYRDTQNGYVGGVSAGLGHYAGIDAIWVRILWIISLSLTGGTSALFYIILWIVLKDAITTNQRLEMMGKEVNINNIRENVEQGFDEVVNEQTSVNYTSSGQKEKRGSVKFFSSLGNIMSTLLKALAKILGLMIFLIGASGLIGLIFGLIGVSAVQYQNTDIFRLLSYSIPENISITWLYLILLFMIGIPFLVMCITGLRLLVNNMRRTSTIFKISLLVLWITSIAGLCFFVAQIGTSTAFDGSTSQKIDATQINTDNVVHIAMSDEHHNRRNHFYIMGNNITLDIDNNDEELIKFFDIKTAIAPSADSTAYVELFFEATGPNLKSAKENAKSIIYPIHITADSIILPDYFTLSKKKINNQEIEAVIFLPEGTKFNWNKEFDYYNRRRIAKDAFSLNNYGQPISPTYQIKESQLECLDCPAPEDKQEPKQTDSKKEDRTEVSISVNNGMWKYTETTTIKKDTVND